ncbi:leucine-rich repeat domain-containing protein [Sutcliffiella halmapala]|uniref:leucine-rich repeat domain-containing protein n=1 Tax=Sutcliffiella halmapala TaxID=79882 RepID=UPI00099537CE|nr:hypothetical protein [Sutcliffiella halmapala]
MQVLHTPHEKEVYIDIFDGEISEEYLELWAEGVSEESIISSWWFNKESQEEYNYKVYLDGKLYEETTETFLVISGLEAEKEYEILVEMYSKEGEFLFDASTSVSTLALPSGNIVSIPDAGLEDSIRQSLFLPDRVIYQSDMERLEFLFSAFMDIKDLTGLEHATHLEFLDITGNQVKELSPLKDLLYLGYLNVADNSITNIDSLSGMYIYNLDLSGNPISDITTLESQIDLEYLYLHNTAITDIEVLLKLEYLSEVSLFGIEGLTFEEGTSELAVVEQLLARGVNAFLNQEEFDGSSPIAINVIDVTEDSIEIDWTYEGEEEVTYYSAFLDQELVNTIEEENYLFSYLSSDTTYDITVAAFDLEDTWIGWTEISVTTLAYDTNEEEKEKPEEDGEEDITEEENKSEETPTVKPVDKQKAEENKTSTDKKTTGNKLPVTATNTLNYILIGFTLLILGCVGVYFSRRTVLS